MADPAPGQWLTILGLGEDGRAGLCDAGRAALDSAEMVMGPPRHLALLGALSVPAVTWPVPFADGLARLLAWRGRRVVVLASGDPFWFGAGSTLAQALEPHEWCALPGRSTFSLAAARLGWALQDVTCLGLHAAPLERVRPHLAPGRRLIVLLRDCDAACALMERLREWGFGASDLWLLEALGGPRERIIPFADAQSPQHPLALALHVAGQGPAMPCTTGLPDDFFASDGQITKQAVRALTLSALAPRAGELLWDIGAGSGSVGIEWLLGHPANRAVGIEADPRRAARARANALALGVDRLVVMEGRAPDCWPQGPAPDAVFIGGGLSDALLVRIWADLPAGTRVVANAVTLESEALLARWHGDKGGQLLRIELADAAPLGTRTGWKARYPLVQWSART